jgi:hypothetical protein
LLSVIEVQKVEGEWPSVRPTHLRESPCKGEQACTWQEETVVSSIWCIDGIVGGRKEGAKLKRRLCRPLKRIQADCTGRCVSGMGARDCRILGEESPSRARPRMRKRIDTLGGGYARMEGVIDLLSPASVNLQGIGRSTTRVVEKEGCAHHTRSLGVHHSSRSPRQGTRLDSRYTADTRCPRS